MGAVPHSAVAHPLTRLICFGVSHHDAGIAVRERLALGADALDAALAASAAQLESAPVAELAILSTCNRIEWYGVVKEGHAPALEPLAHHFASLGALPGSLLIEFGHLRTGIDAARHLCRVSSGLESQLLGEAEVLGQVDAARAAAVSASTMGPTLTLAFRAALRAGRRARSETTLGRRNANMASEAVRIAGATLGGFAGKSVLVLGTGVIGRQALQALADAGAANLAVSARDAARLKKTAEESGARAVAPAQLRAALSEADLVICATAARQPVITRELVRAARADASRPLLLVDIGLPRNVERSVSEEAHVTLFHLDELAARAERGDASIAQAAEKAEGVVAEEIARLERALLEQRAVPVLREIHQRADAIRRRQMARLVRELGVVPAEAVEPLERFSRALVNQVLDAPTRRLRRASDDAAEAHLLAAAKELFDVSPQGEEPL
jgi:glutamyl-tRNA reductase